MLREVWPGGRIDVAIDGGLLVFDRASSTDRRSIARFRPLSHIAQLLLLELESRN